MANVALLMRGLHDTFSSGVTKTYEWRLQQLKQLLNLVEENEDRVASALTEDIGKPRFETFVTEVSLLKASCKFAINNLKRWMTPEKVSNVLVTYPSSSEIVPEPLGVVLIISAWNYPFLLSMDPLIGALAAGNVAVLKPSELASATSALLAELIPKYLDNAAVRVVEGGVTESAALLEQRWDKIFYTGGAQVGRIIMSAAAKHLTPVTLELGGKCPVIVDSTVDLELASRRIAFGKWVNNNGQACIAPDYIITLKALAPKLVNSLTTTLERFYGKDPVHSEDLSRIINFRHFTRITGLLDDPDVSSKIVYGGMHDEKKLKISPTLLLDVPLNSKIMREEIFGPLLPIITVEDREEAFEVIKEFPKPLAAYVFTSDSKFEKQALRNISAGGMVINDIAVHLANPHLPFGGVGESGTGSYHGKFSFDTFSHKKAVLYKSLKTDLMARYPPYTTKKQLILRHLLEGKFLGLLLVLLGVKSK